MVPAREQILVGSFDASAVSAKSSRRLETISCSVARRHIQRGMQGCKRLRGCRVQTASCARFLVASGWTDRNFVSNSGGPYVPSISKYQDKA